MFLWGLWVRRHFSVLVKFPSFTLELQSLAAVLASQMPTVPFALKSDPFLSLKTIYTRVKTQDMLNVVVSTGNFLGKFFEKCEIPRFEGAAQLSAFDLSMKSAGCGKWQVTQCVSKTITSK
jgi:hypothetical protein